MTDSSDWNDDFLHNFRQAPPSQGMDELWQRLVRRESMARIAHRTTTRRLAWGAAALFAVSLLLFSFPQVRSLAQDIIDLFVQSESDKREQPVSMPSDRPSDEPPLHILGGSKATFEQAMVFVDFVIPEPVVPEPYELSRIRVKGQAVSAEYRVTGAEAAPYPEGVLFIGISAPVSTEPGVAPSFGLSVGASAQIVPVDLGQDVQAGYVAGAWVHPETGAFGSWALTPDENGLLAYSVWDNDYPAQYLRWVYNGMLYTVYGYNLELEQADLIGIARSMLPEAAR